MNDKSLEALLRAVADGTVSPHTALRQWKDWGVENLGFARVDHHRVTRKGFPEVIFGQNKSAEQIAAIASALHQRGSTVLATRVNEDKAGAVQALLPALHYHPLCHALSLPAGESLLPGRGLVGVIAAGTSDLPVAEEAALTAELMGSKVERLWDVGVSGLHRLLSHEILLKEASCLVVAAGMEGALPSVVAGLCACPVVAVPTSIGYGASFGGLAALLGMLNSCAPGLSVVNIDNGFGGGYLAGLIDHQGKR
ncbi:MAG: nickel pincer cofactor biosynthesis protein LarB [Desulfarculales bacterium]|jgi:NCAIR mutase (PurE)-related protein|nr:nickel pincer cofactor biosynthesis protein LarB [Desulfarculales bacterium]